MLLRVRMQYIDGKVFQMLNKQHQKNQIKKTKWKSNQKQNQIKSNQIKQNPIKSNRISKKFTRNVDRKAD